MSLDGTGGSGGGLDGLARSGSEEGDQPGEPGGEEGDALGDPPIETEGKELGGEKGCCGDAWMLAAVQSRQGMAIVSAIATA